ncbi:hypothetical protein PINS_up012522 [Pythium insidiosum]|nr:hypothetical protein PINS_up012522 [Pythium insidiosum]
MPPLIDDEDDGDIGVSDEDELELIEALEGEDAKIALQAEKEEMEIFAGLSGSQSFQDTKWTYYQRKFGIERGDGSAKNAELERVKRHYMEAIVWCLEYYFQGPPSWSWYYPYHYAPMVSDLTDIESVLRDICFDHDASGNDGPLRPFEQLMANLPSSSSHLVPEPYRFLMVSPLSPIKHFYPEKFDIDMEGKKNAWEGVNLLPFIDVALLKSAIAQFCPDSRLTAAERKRNELQMLPLRIVHDPKAVETVPSTMPGLTAFPDIINCCTRVEPYQLPEITVFEGRFQSKLMEGVTLPLAGFPSLYTLPLESVRFQYVGLNCFGMSSRKDSMILQLPQTGSLETAVNPHAILGTVVLVNWPNLHEAKVVGVSSLAGEYRLEKSRGRHEVVFTPYDGDKKTDWAQYAMSECSYLLSGRGTPGSGGIDLGVTGITCVLHVLPLQGMIANPLTGAVEKKFGQEEAVVPLQLAVIDRELYDERFKEINGVSLEERFPVDSTALITQGEWLGCTAKVKSCDPVSNTVMVEVNTIDVEPPFGYVIAEKLVERFYPGYMVAQKLGISTTTLGVITGSVRVKPGDAEIGLNLRFRKDLLLPGYCRLVTKGSSSRTSSSADEENVWRKGDIVQILGSGVSISTNDDKERNKRSSANGSGNSTTWEYTDRTIAVIAAYKAQFPEVFINLDKMEFAKSYSGQQLFGIADKKRAEAKAEEIMAWIDTQAFGKKDHSKHVPISSTYVSVSAMRAMEAAGSLRAKEREKESAQRVGNPVIVEIFAGDLFRPNPLVNQDLTGSEVAQRATRNPGAPRLGDRVINITARGVPLGHRGTVVATHVASKCVEVLFDEAFTGGEPLYGSTSMNRGKVIPWNHVICVSSPPGEQGPTRRSEHKHKDRAGNHRQQPPSSSQVSGVLQVSSNQRQGRKPRDREAAASNEKSVGTGPSPAPPNPEKIQSLLQKWSKGKPESGAASNPSSTQASGAPHPAKASAEKKTIAPMPESSTSAEPPASEDIAPAVAALFSAAAAQADAAPVVTPNGPEEGSRSILTELFPHLANGSMATAATPQPPAPPAYSMPPTGYMAPPMPYPDGYMGYAYPPHAYAQPMYYPPAPEPAAPAASVNTPVSSLTEFPPLGSEPAPKPVDASKRGRGSAHKSGDKTWVPKDKGSAGAAAPSSTKTPTLLRPAQVMRHQSSKSGPAVVDSEPCKCSWHHNPNACSFMSCLRHPDVVVFMDLASSRQRRNPSNIGSRPCQQDNRPRWYSRRPRCQCSRSPRSQVSWWPSFS